VKRRVLLIGDLSLAPPLIRHGRTARVAVSALGGSVHERPNLLTAVDVDVDPMLARLLLDISDRVRGEPVELACALEDSVEDRQDLVDRLIGESALGDDLRAPASTAAVVTSSRRS